jgi:cytochrome oxidase Cu insertion factor (SCO1/SenC/PrrC family)
MLGRTCLAVLALLLVALVAEARGSRGHDRLEAGDVALAVPLEAVVGDERVDLEDTGGKPVVLVFGSYT